METNDTHDGMGRWRAAAYARLSREDKVEGLSDSIIGQRNLIRDWAVRRGNVELVAEYEDDGVSGATFDRPGFERMMDDAAHGLFDTIVVKDLSRLGRSYLDCGCLIERDLPRLGVRLYSISDRFDSMSRWDYDTALLLPMKNLMNEMLVISTSEKVRTSLRAKRERGECVANFAPYGYCKDSGDKHKLRVNPLEAKVVRRVFQMRLDGMSASSIARTLNAESVPSPAASKRMSGSAYRSGFCRVSERVTGDGGPPTKWHPNTVMRILRNEVYIGTLVQGKTQRPSWRMRIGLPVPPEEWQRSPNAHEAIIDPETFATMETLLSEEADRG